jgi:mRNA interferase MazF
MFRPEVEVVGKTTLVLTEQTMVVNPERLGPCVGRLTFEELRAVDGALIVVLGLDRTVLDDT